MSATTDWITAITALVATGIASIAAKIGIDTFKRQLATSDIELSTTIFSEINRYWDRISDEQGSYVYNMGQILAHFEIASALFNSKVLSSKATVILGDHIIEIFTALQATDTESKIIDICASSPTTFRELRAFARSKMPQALSTLGWQEHKNVLDRDAS